MSNDILEHHGILGMKWGVRRFQNKDGTLTSAGKKRKAGNLKDIEPEGNNTKSISSMSDSELREAINRIEMERKYERLITPNTPQKVSEGKKFVMDILKESGKNVGTQAGVYIMGTAINKIAKKEIVNPKKGQKK